MKAIKISRQAGQPLEGMPRMTIVPGSAIVMPGKPWFMPDMELFGIKPLWSVVPGLAFRLSRLGKGIEPRFASRYYDAAAPVLFLQSPELEQFESFQSAIDGAMALGNWQPLADSYQFVVNAYCTDGKGAFSPTLPAITAAEAAADEIVARLSSCMTIQMGDILVACQLGVRYNVYYNCRLEVALNGVDALAVRIK